eukprot:scaffold2378_cov424-Prasinococcus_capsulatus_cf.AAC.4
MVKPRPGAPLHHGPRPRAGGLRPCTERDHLDGVARPGVSAGADTSTKDHALPLPSRPGPG